VIPSDDKMTTKEGSKEIKKLLGVLARQRTDRKRLFVLFKIRVLLDAIEEKLKARRDKADAAFRARTQIIKRALKQFLTALDGIYAKHEEVGDTAVREQLGAAVHQGFIKRQRGYCLPNRFGMFSRVGDDLVRAAIERFLTHAEIRAASRALASPEARLAAFQDGDVETRAGTTYFDYFGYTRKPRAGAPP
jgi:hypothetical protein